MGNPFEVIGQTAASPQPAESHQKFALQLPPVTPAAPHHSPQLGPEVPATLAAIPAKPAGMEGCCPVTLRDRRVMVPGKAEHATEWQGVTYRFASAQAQAEFEAQPEHYAPAKGGQDVILLADSGQNVPGTLEHAVWYHHQLYLFQSSQTMEAFSASPEKYCEQ